MMNLISFINKLKTADIVFLAVCVAIVAISVGVYFLIPLLNKKQYQEQRENLRKREAALKSNVKSYNCEVLSSEKSSADKPSESE